jgi:hypothetical protein
MQRNLNTVRDKSCLEDLIHNRSLMDEIKKYSAGALVQGRQVWKILFFVYLAIGLMFVGVGILSQVVKGHSLEFFLRDIVATGKLPFFAGFVSQLGGMLWCASLTVCLFSLLILRRQDAGLASSRRFLLQAAILTGVLLLDDIFLFHEDVGPHYLHIPEKVVMVGYMLLGIAFVILNRKEILSSEYLLLLLALAMLGISVFLDALPIDDFGLPYFFKRLEIFLEDGFKFAGIATWLIYFVRYAAQKLSLPARE